jgi:hypothetical protein
LHYIIIHQIILITWIVIPAYCFWWIMKQKPLWVSYYAISNP